MVENVKREESLGLYGVESYSAISLSSIGSLAQWKRRWLSGHAVQVRIPSFCGMPLAENLPIVFAIRYIYYVWCGRRFKIAETRKNIKREESLGLYDLLSSCSPVTNPILLWYAMWKYLSMKSWKIYLLRIKYTLKPNFDFLVLCLPLLAIIRLTFLF